ncbi:MAG: hypothetical protein J5771_06960 [Bacteroidales bacterium]|nr:hypothetical protein [Bacteroidales bacterium]
MGRKAYIVLILALGAALLAASCESRPEDPVTEAVKAKIAENVKGLPSDVRIDRLELIDSSALGTELARCKELFSLKIRREKELYTKYWNKGQYNAADAKSKVIQKAQKNYDGIVALEREHEAAKDSIIAYHYMIAGSAKNAEGGKVEFKEAYVALTPDGKVLTLVTDRRDLGKVARHAIPGYLELLGAEKEE